MSTYITLAEAKTHCHVDFTDDDVYIQSLADMVEQMVLAEISGTYTGEGTVTTAGAVALVGAATNFTEFDVGDVIKVEGETDRTINGITTDTALTVSLAFTTTAANLTWEIYTGMPLVGGVLPLALKHSLLLMVEHFYSIRGPVMVGVNTSKVPYSFMNLIAPFKHYTVV